MSIFQVRLVLQGEEIQNGTNWTKVVSTHPIRINDAHALKRLLFKAAMCKYFVRPQCIELYLIVFFQNVRPAENMNKVCLS